MKFKIIQVFVITVLMANSIVYAQSYDVLELGNNFASFDLNDSGTIVGLNDGSYENGYIYKTAIRLPGQNWQSIGDGKHLDPYYNLSLSNDNAVAGIEQETGDLLILRKGQANILARKKTGSINSFSLGDNGKLAILELHEDNKMYFVFFTNIFNSQIPTNEIQVPIYDEYLSIYYSKTFVLKDGKVFVSIGDRDKNHYFTLQGASLNPVSENVLPASSIIISRTGNSIVIVPIDPTTYTGTSGQPYIADLINPPQAYAKNLPNKSFNTFSAVGGNEKGQAIADYGSLGFYNYNNYLQLLSPESGINPLDCFIPNNIRLSFTTIDYAKSKINSVGQILSMARSQDIKNADLKLVLLTPNQKPSTNYCANTSTRLLSKCGEGNSKNCKVEVKLINKIGKALDKSTVAVFRYGKFTPDADGGYYPGPAKLIGSGKTNSKGKVNVSFPLAKGNYLYEVIAPYNNKTYRAKAKTFEIQR